MICIQVLGPLTLRVVGPEVRLGPRQRVLLLCLLLAAGQPIAAVRLAYLLWDGAEPEQWQATLRSHVYHLRQAMADPATDSVLVTERIGDALGYALRISGLSVDVARFERLLADGSRALTAARYVDASAKLGDALALWRGRPLADVAGRAFAVPEIRRLEGLRRTAYTARIEADVQLGRHRESIGELEVMLARWPDDDGLRRLLITSLYRSERPAEAAQVCRNGIELALGQGLDVRSLQDLQREVLMASRAFGRS